VVQIKGVESNIAGSNSTELGKGSVPAGNGPTQLGRENSAVVTVFSHHERVISIATALANQTKGKWWTNGLFRF
jgi:hypothetical protein